jgi:RNA polymerase sigma factor (sigma-70 family)
VVLQLDTARVVEAARAGDPAALDAVVAQYLPLVYTVVRRSLRRSADVDDVVQETMLRVVRGVGSLRDPQRLRAWVVAVAVNQIREHQRSAPTYAASFDEWAELPDPGGEFVERTLIQLDVSGQRRETQQAAQWLDPDHRELLSLWWLEASGHLSRPELADALQADPHHVAVRVSRMKEQLDTARRLVRALALSPRCPLLEEAGYEWRGETSSVWRKRFARHIRECPHCGSAAHGLIEPERLLAGLALLPLPAAYVGFRVTELLVHPQQVTLGDPTRTQVLGQGHGAGGAAGHQGPADVRTEVLHGHGDGADGGEGHPPSSGHRGGSHRGGKAGKAGAKTALIGKPLGIAVAAVGVLAVAAAAVIELQPQQHQAASIAVTSPATVLPSSAPKPSAATIVLPSPSLAPSTPATSAKPSVAPSTHPATSASAAAPRTSAAAATSSAASAGSNSADAAQQVLDVINQARSQAGLKPYTMSNDLIDSASAHNTRMEDGCGLSHQCPGEPALGDRETAAGVQWTAAGENIGDGGPVSDSQSPIAQMAVSLTNSMLAEQPPNDGHRLNILSSSFTEVGIAVTRDSSGTVWMTQDFAN